MKAAIAAMLLMAGAASAAPPPKDSEDWALMSDFRAWVETQHSASGQWCCDWSDGRPLFGGEWRETDAGYEVLISRRHWANAPAVAMWVKVPRDHVVGASPLGLPVAWWIPEGGAQGVLFCFAPVGGV